MAQYYAELRFVGRNEECAPSRARQDRGKYDHQRSTNLELTQRRDEREPIRAACNADIRAILEAKKSLPDVAASEALVPPMVPQ